MGLKKHLWPCAKTEVVFLHWEDACGGRDAHDLSDNINIGYIHYQDEHKTVLCHGVTTTGELDLMTIPTKNVLGIEPVRR
jgi:hypothetical protein